MQLGKDLSLLRWEVGRYWNYYIRALGEMAGKFLGVHGREASISRFINVGCFVAVLVATDEPIFSGYATLGPATLRDALESPSGRADRRS
jgi:hypothetical protein